MESSTKKTSAAGGMPTIKMNKDEHYDVVVVGAGLRRRLGRRTMKAVESLPMAAMN